MCCMPFMGVPGLFLYYSSKYPEILSKSAYTDILCLDFNGIVHNSVKPDISEEQILQNVGSYLEGILMKVSDSNTKILRECRINVQAAYPKLLFISIDGVAPRAKLNQQRSRRYEAAFGDRVERLVPNGGCEENSVVDASTNDYVKNAMPNHIGYPKNMDPRVFASESHFQEDAIRTHVEYPKNTKPRVFASESHFQEDAIRTHVEYPKDAGSERVEHASSKTCESLTTDIPLPGISRDNDPKISFDSVFQNSTGKGTAAKTDKVSDVFLKPDTKGICSTSNDNLLKTLNTKTESPKMNTNDSETFTPTEFFTNETENDFQEDIPLELPDNLLDPDLLESSSDNITFSFDKNAITPGTLFMEKLDAFLITFIENKMNSNSAWQQMRVIYSSSKVEGEGEQKILRFLRNLNSDYDNLDFGEYEAKKMKDLSGNRRHPYNYRGNTDNGGYRQPTSRFQGPNPRHTYNSKSKAENSGYRQPTSRFQEHSPRHTYDSRNNTANSGYIHPTSRYSYTDINYFPDSQTALSPINKDVTDYAPDSDYISKSRFDTSAEIQRVEVPTQNSYDNAKYSVFESKPEHTNDTSQGGCRSFRENHNIFSLSLNKTTSLRPYEHFNYKHITSSVCRLSKYLNISKVEKSMLNVFVEDSNQETLFTSKYMLYSDSETDSDSSEPYCPYELPQKDIDFIGENAQKTTPPALYCDFQENKRFLDLSEVQGQSQSPSDECNSSLNLNRYDCDILHKNSHINNNQCQTNYAHVNNSQYQTKNAYINFNQCQTNYAHVNNSQYQSSQNTPRFGSERYLRTNRSNYTEINTQKQSRSFLRTLTPNRVSTNRISSLHQKITIYSPDADMFFLCLPFKNITLMREDQSGRKCKNCDRKGHLTINCADLTKIHYCFVSIDILRDRILSKLKSRLKFETEDSRIISDYIFVMFMVGNDFLPNINCFDVRLSALDIIVGYLVQFYNKVGLYLTKHGVICYQALFRFLKGLFLKEKMLYARKIIALRSLKKRFKMEHIDDVNLCTNEGQHQYYLKKLFRTKIEKFRDFQNEYIKVDETTKDSTENIQECPVSETNRGISTVCDSSKTNNEIMTVCDSRETQNEMPSNSLRTINEMSSDSRKTTKEMLSYSDSLKTNEEMLFSDSSKFNTFSTSKNEIFSDCDIENFLRQKNYKVNAENIQNFKTTVMKTFQNSQINLEGLQITDQTTDKKQPPDTPNEYFYEKNLDLIDLRRECVKNYLCGMQWTLRLYTGYQGNWGYFYNYHYSPLLSDFGLLGKKDIQEIIDYSKKKRTYNKFIQTGKYTLRLQEFASNSRLYTFDKGGGHQESKNSINHNVLNRQNSRLEKTNNHQESRNTIDLNILGRQNNPLEKSGNHQESKKFVNLNILGRQNNPLEKTNNHQESKNSINLNILGRQNNNSFRINSFETESDKNQCFQNNTTTFGEYNETQNTQQSGVDTNNTTFAENRDNMNEKNQELNGLTKVITPSDEYSPLCMLEQSTVVMPQESKKTLPILLNMIFNAQKNNTDIFPKKIISDQFDKLMAWQSVAILPFVETSKIRNIFFQWYKQILQVLNDLLRQKHENRSFTNNYETDIENFEKTKHSKDDSLVYENLDKKGTHYVSFSTDFEKENSNENIHDISNSETEKEQLTIDSVKDMLTEEIISTFYTNTPHQEILFISNYLHESEKLREIYKHQKIETYYGTIRPYCYNNLKSPVQKYVFTSRRPK